MAEHVHLQNGVFHAHRLGRVALHADNRRLLFLLSCFGSGVNRCRLLSQIASQTRSELLHLPLQNIYTFIQRGEGNLPLLVFRAKRVAHVGHGHFDLVGVLLFGNANADHRIALGLILEISIHALMNPALHRFNDFGGNMRVFKHKTCNHEIGLLCLGIALKCSLGLFGSFSFLRL